MVDNSKKGTDTYIVVEPHLDNSETLVWSGQSKMRMLRISPYRFVQNVALLILYILMFGMMSSIYIEFGIDYDSTFYFLVAMLFLLFLNFLWSMYVRGIPKRRAICFATDKRAAHFSPRKGKKDKVRSYPLSNITRIRTKIYPDGWGNIRFNLKTYDPADMKFPAPLISWGWTDNGFFDVEDVEAATHHLSELTGIRPTVRKNLVLGIF